MATTKVANVKLGARIEVGSDRGALRTKYLHDRCDRFGDLEQHVLGGGVASSKTLQNVIATGLRVSAVSKR